LEINQGYTTMHGQPIITVYVYLYLLSWVATFFSFCKRRPPDDEQGNARNM